MQILPSSLSVYQNKCSSKPIISLEHCIQFDGVSEFTHTRGINYMGGDFTLEFWIKDYGVQLRPNGNNQSFVLFNSTCRASVVMIAGQPNIAWTMMTGSLFNDGTISLAGYNPANWLHVAFRYIRNEYRRQYFLNGVMIGQNVLSGPTSGPQGHLAIGAGGPVTNVSGYFTGKLDEFRLYTRAISEGEILYSYNEGLANLPLNTADLAYWYPFEEKGRNLGYIGQAANLVMRNFVNDPTRLRNS